jgi:hypothetical protein
MPAAQYLEYQLGQNAMQHWLSLNVRAAAFAAAGTKLLVVHQTDSCFVAVSKQRQLGIVAVNLPAGVLLASFSRPVLPTAALSEVQASCAAAFAACG